MQRYLLVLDMDLLAVDEKFDLEPINYLVAQQEREPCEVVVLSLVDTAQTKLPAMELLLGAKVGKFPVAPRPDHDISAAAEHRMNLAVRHLKMIGCRASGLISDEDLLKAVRDETRRGDYDGVILATGRQDDSLLAGVLGRGSGSPVAAALGRAADRIPARFGRGGVRCMTELELGEKPRWIAISAGTFTSRLRARPTVGVAAQAILVASLPP